VEDSIMAWTLSGESIHKVWMNSLIDNGKQAVSWSQLADVTKNAWNEVAATLVKDVQRVTNTSNDDKISWVIGMLNNQERARIYQLLYNMGHRIR
jgi:hypothetical protein